MAQEYIFSLQKGTLETVGGKGASLARLLEAGLPVPGGFTVATAAYRQFVAQNDLQAHIDAALERVDVSLSSSLEAASRDIAARFMDATVPSPIADAVAGAYARMGDDLAVAVRSSATAEDRPDFSFAGQQETFLNVCGLEAVQDAVKRCWASLWTGRAIGYRVRNGVDQRAISLAVVVQRQVLAESAGVMFTANPVNGSREQVVINAAWGLGEAVVGGLVSPDTVIADKKTGRVEQIEVADKMTMTVPTPEGTAERPVSPAKRQARVLDDAQVAELVRLGQEIEALYGVPQDIEWCRAKDVDGRPAFFILQSRPITTLGKAGSPSQPLPHVPPPDEWQVPNRRAKYMRNNIVELMPDPLTPLFGTLGRRVINSSMKLLMTAFLGRSDMMPDELIIKIHDYAYYNGEFTTKQILMILWNSVGIMKHMFTGWEQRWRDGRSDYAAVVKAWQDKPWRTFSATEILDGVPEVMGAAITYYGALVSGLIPGAWISEGLFTLIYDRLIKGKGDPAAVTYLLGFDSTPIQAEKVLYDLARWARSRAGLATYLSRTPASRLASQLVSGLETDVVLEESEEGWREWRERFRAYLQQYGAMMYDLDFAKPTPADDPAPLLETFKLFLAGQGSDPHARQRAATERREQAMQVMLDKLKGFRLRLFRNHVSRAQKYVSLREDGLADIGLGYPLLRQMLLEVGSRLARAGAIAAAADIFWLTERQVREAAGAVDGGRSVSYMGEDVQARKALWRAEKQVTPPVALPMPPRFLMKWFPSQFGGQTGDDAAAQALRGTGCSAGVVTGTARVMQGPEDFDQMEPGDVLVAAITTPAWTPLFAMASAIVTDIGGPLSHGSIVAREYGIPAVLGTGAATKCLRTGDRVRVDGEKGVVEIVQRAGE